MCVQGQTALGLNPNYIPYSICNVGKLLNICASTFLSIKMGLLICLLKKVLSKPYLWINPKSRSELSPWRRRLTSLFHIDKKNKNAEDRYFRGVTCWEQAFSRPYWRQLLLRVAAPKQLWAEARDLVLLVMKFSSTGTQGHNLNGTLIESSAEPGPHQQVLS